MKFEDLETRLRAFEAHGEEKLSFDGRLVARLDGRGFTHLTKSSLDLEKPFDIRFHEAMKHAALHLCDRGFSVRLAFSHSDEISLLFEPNERGFNGKVRKWLSVLAGEASAAFSLKLGHIGAFDCRLVPLPDDETVVDYFRWRQTDALRNALNAHCYWILRKKYLSSYEATHRLEGLTVEEKYALLAEHGIDIEALPLWQTRGFSVTWQDFEKIGFNPRAQRETSTIRRRLHVDSELQNGDEFGKWLEELISE